MLELKQTQKLAQQLVLTPQLQQAIKLLQLSQLELIEAIEQEIKENPVLEGRRRRSRRRKRRAARKRKRCSSGWRGTPRPRILCPGRRRSIPITRTS